VLIKYSKAFNNVVSIDDGFDFHWRGAPWQMLSAHV
jgi:hypothetical protein